jgi:hypothetical protein
MVATGAAVARSTLTGAMMIGSNNVGIVGVVDHIRHCGLALEDLDFDPNND